MPNYRRLRIEGGTHFFTVTLADRRSDLLVRRIDLLRAAWCETLLAQPFAVDTVVVLPDHLHAIWTLPSGDDDFSGRWSRLKAAFSRALPQPQSLSPSLRGKREKGVWQRRFWEHAIRDEQDLIRCRKYCWANPVKHELVSRPTDWPHSSIHRDIRRGLVDEEWIDGDAVGEYGERREPAVGWASAHRE